MKTDPNKACANAEERLLWALIHDAIAHPLMALSGYAAWAMRFHDYTSHKAWPRCSIPSFVVNKHNEQMLEALQTYCRGNNIPHMIEGKLTDQGYEYRIRFLS